ncbi:BON domain-containing protein [Jeongeupia naejangsanensis]|uniref:BON domain-containing protein n=1 Tax=Jeongeupia naejangsanensis TaxID=613195 RepID=A0ABS2BMP2_9NEIS|nr:BON domain-containing protein [Jeongeupia naejangsanensis]MBM3116897.1 BON domain-containing protein [Jeongeupia naejangsanensis]
MHKSLILTGLLALVPASAVIAAETAESTSGTVEQIGKSGGAFVDDSILTGQVKAALFGDQALSVLQIKVTTRQGVVVLSGTVDSAEQRAKAITIAAGVSGVRDVRSALVVQPS